VAVLVAAFVQNRLGVAAAVKAAGADNYV